MTAATLIIDVEFDFILVDVAQLLAGILQKVFFALRVLDHVFDPLLFVMKRLVLRGKQFLFSADFPELLLLGYINNRSDENAQQAQQQKKARCEFFFGHHF